MPYRRRMKKQVRRRKYRLRRGRLRLYKRMNRQGLFHMKQTVNGSTIACFGSRTISQGLLANNYGVEFRFRDIPQHGTLASIWDQYRINKIVFTLIPMANVNTVGSIQTLNHGVVASVIDYDNAGQPLAALDQYEQYTNCKISPVVRGARHTRVFRPRVNYGVQNQGGSILAGGNRGKQWLDCSLVDIVHNGIKLYVDPFPVGTPGAAQTFQIFCKYYISFRNVH